MLKNQKTIHYETFLSQEMQRIRHSLINAQIGNSQRGKYVLSSHSFRGVFKKRTQSLFFTAYPDEHRELAMDVLQVRGNIPRGWRTHRIRYPYIRRRLSRSHAHHVEYTHTSRKSLILGAASTIPANVAKVGPVNHLLYSMFNQIDISIKNSCRQQGIPSVRRGIIKLCFIRKNFPSDLLPVRHGYPDGRNVRLGNTQTDSRKMRALHLQRIRIKSVRASSLQHFQSR